jgi:poly-beta-hydroxybutyrate-responsive repressor
MPTRPHQPTAGDKPAPRDFLQAWILLLLRNWQAHGYALQSALTRAGFTGLDHSVLYRELRALEEKGFLRSAWKTGDSGPARRTYTITADGERVLGALAEDMQAYQRQMAQFLGDYFKTFAEFATPPSQPGSANKGKQSNSKGRSKRK